MAGDRGRKANYTSGAAKGLIERYAEGLQHRLAGSGVAVVLVKLGPTDTPTTAPMKARGGRPASVEIMFVVRNLPRVVFNRLNI